MTLRTQHIELLTTTTERLLATGAHTDEVSDPAARWVMDSIAKGRHVPQNAATLRALQTGLSQLRFDVPV